MGTSSGFTFSTTIDAALNFQFNSKQKVGHIRTLEMSGKEVKPDFKIRDPKNPSGYIGAATLSSSLEWDKKPGGIIKVEGVVSAANQGIVKHAIKDAKDSKSGLKIHPILYKYHNDKGLYFETWHSDGKPLECDLSQEYESDISDEPIVDYKQKDLYPFVLYLIAKEGAPLQKINLDYDTEIKLSLDFGQDK